MRDILAKLTEMNDLVKTQKPDNQTVKSVLRESFDAMSGDESLERDEGDMLTEENDQDVIADVLSSIGFEEGSDFIFDSGKLVVFGRKTASVALNALKMDGRISGSPHAESADGQEVVIGFGMIADKTPPSDAEISALAKEPEKVDESKVTITIDTEDAPQTDTMGLQAIRMLSGIPSITQSTCASCNACPCVCAQEVEEEAAYANSPEQKELPAPEGNDLNRAKKHDYTIRNLGNNPMAESSSLMRKYSDLLTEARRTDLAYTEKKVKGALDKVIVDLRGHESGAMTKLAKRYMTLDDAIKRLTEIRAATNANVKVIAEDYFDAEDVVLTRVIQTVSATLQLSKRLEAKDKVTVNYEAIALELAKLIGEELKPQVDAIYAAYTTSTPGEVKSPALSIKPVEEGFFSDIGIKAADTAAKLLASIRSWAASFDDKLAEIKAKL